MLTLFTRTLIGSLLIECKVGGVKIVMLNHDLDIHVWGFKTDGWLPGDFLEDMLVVKSIDLSFCNYTPVNLVIYSP